MSIESEPTATGTSVRWRRVHPLTWVIAGLLLPLACWDVRQAQHDVRLRREASAQQVKHPSSALPANDTAALSPVLAAR